MQSRCIVTGGEDSLIHIWPSSNTTGASTPTSTTATPTASAIINKRLVSIDDEGDTMMGTPTPPTSPRRLDDGVLPPTRTKGKKRKTDDSAPSGDKKRGKQRF
ncbi:hypothetical protein FRC01_013314 [Tulasnella sp. 417]|nr:hypothetical protein FRC01_013314 [Tulasnella sp. 417]